jgi:glucokinase
MSVIIAIDIGGTQIRTAAYSLGNINPIKVRRKSTHASRGTVYDRLIKAVAYVWPSGQTVEAISTAVSGPLDSETGIILLTPNIKEWTNFPLGEKLNSRFGVPVYVNNDAKMAAVGEWRYGAGKGHHDVLYLTIGTGIGGGVILDDHLLLGQRGLATELGHVTVLPDGPLCSCGQRGHLEAVASGPAIAKYVSEKIAEGRQSVLGSGATLTARAVAEAAQQGDELSKEAFIRAGTFIGQATAGFLHIFNPSIVIFGGGVSRSGDLILDPIKESMRNNIMDPAYLDGVEIAIAELGDNAGLLGSLAQAYARLSKQ